MSPTTNDHDRSDEHTRRELRRKAFRSTIFTILGILIAVGLVIAFLLAAKP